MCHIILKRRMKRIAIVLLTLIIIRTGQAFIQSVRKIYVDVSVLASNSRLQQVEENLLKFSNEIRAGQELLKQSITANEEYIRKFRQSLDDWRKEKEEEKRNWRKEKEEEERNWRNERQEEDRKLRKSLNELIGYNQNADGNLEISLGVTLHDYLSSGLGVPESCIQDVPVHSIFDPVTGDTAVEWDGILVVNYADFVIDNPAFHIPDHWPANNTIFLLDSKHHLNATAVLSSLPTRISKTYRALTSTFTPTKKRIRDKITRQKLYYSDDPLIIAVVGGRNVHGETAEQILRSGFLAIGPSGEGFQVIDSPAYKVKIFDGSSLPSE